MESVSNNKWFQLSSLPQYRLEDLIRLCTVERFGTNQFLACFRAIHMTIIWLLRFVFMHLPTKVFRNER
jgi:hypothetical protein